jgi:RNA polymerase sigma-70 factor, ECF subfamily
MVHLIWTVTFSSADCKRHVTSAPHAFQAPTFNSLDVLQRVSRGDTQAFAELVVHYQRPLFAFLGRMGLNAARAEEVAQETFLRAWQHLPSYRSEQAQFSTWLFTIARRLALNELTRSQHRHEVGSDDKTPEPASSDAGPEQTLEQRQLQEQVHAALRSLSTDDRSVLALAYTHELSAADIAVIEGCSVDAVKTRLHRARQRLRVALETSKEQGHEV